MIRAAFLMLLLGTACTVPDIDDLHCDDSERLTPNEVAGGSADGVVGGTAGACSALRVSISYATFRTQCLTLTVVDMADSSLTDSTEVQLVPGVLNDTRTAVVMRRDGWSRNLWLTATAHERSCNGALVAEQSADAKMPVVGVSEVSLVLRAEDLDGG